MTRILKKSICILLINSLIFVLGFSSLASDGAMHDQKVSIPEGFEKEREYSADKIKGLTKIKIDILDSDVEIVSVKPAVDFSQNEYTIIECSPSGYFIFNNESGIFVEYSLDSLSPYRGVENNLYYGGPTYYFQEEDSGYRDIITKKSYSSSLEHENMSICSQMQENLLRNKNDSIIKFIEKSNENLYSTNQKNLEEKLAVDSLISTTATETNYWCTSYTFFKNKKSGFGYYVPSGSDGICGYIAASLIFQYYDSRGKISLASSYKSNPVNLTKALRNVGSSLGYGDNTVAYKIKNVINNFAKSKGYPQKASNALSSVGITGEIKNNKRPCILFGNLKNAGNHAVVVYGYNNYEIAGFTTYVCHYGWNNYSNVHVSGDLYGSNVKYKI